MIFEVDVGGRLYEVDAPSMETAAQAVTQIGGEAGVQAPRRPTGMGNVIGGGLAEGAINLATMPRLGFDAFYGLGRMASQKLGLGQPGNQATPIYNVVSKGFGPSADELKRGVEPITGPFPEAGTTGEKFAHRAAEFVPGGMASMPRNMVRGAINYGVVPGLSSEYGRQRAEGTKYEIPASIAGALIGAGAGAGLDRATTGVKNYLANRGAASELSDILGTKVGPGAAGRVSASAMADALTGPGAAAGASKLGNEAMVMDLGRQLRGRAEAVAAQPGRGQNVVLDAVEGRTGRFGEGTAQRVQQTLNQEMGRTQNVVELVDRVDDAVNRISRPLYQRVMAAHEVVNVPAAVTERPAVAQAMKNATTLARQHGENIGGVTERRTILSGSGYNIGEDVTIPAKTSLRYWDYVKKDLDRRINAYKRSGGASELNSADKADLAGLMEARGALVRHLDDVTQGAYREARQAAATKYELREALDYGRSAFNSRLLPEEFAAELAEMSVPQRTMAQVGFRRELDRLIETTRNEGASARRILDTNSVLQKTEMLFGREAAEAISRRINAENTFQEATQDIARNSRTAVRQQLMKDTTAPNSTELRQASGVGMALAGARGILNYGRGQGMETTRSQIADLLTASGPQIDPVVASLLRLGDRRTMNNAVSGNKAAALVSALIQGRQ